MKLHNNKLTRANLRDFILGWQDGLVNVLSLILGIAGATNNSKIVIISGLVATFAESISMAAVAFTSSKAAKDYYYSELEREKQELKQKPGIEKRIIKSIFYKKGFRRKLLSQIVNKIISNKKVWLDTVMSEELRIFSEDYEKPLKNAMVVGISTVIGSLIPLMPFFFLPVSLGIFTSLILAILVLFFVGAVKAKLTIGDWKTSGIQMALIGTIAALIGYYIGVLLGNW